MFIARGLKESISEGAEALAELRGCVDPHKTIKAINMSLLAE